MVHGKRISDVLTFYLWFQNTECNAINESMPKMPLNPFPEHLLEVTKFEPVTLSSNTPRVTLRSATLKDMPHVEDLIRQAALSGEGFALDEFQDGFFNRKFLRRSHTFVATQPIVTSSSYDSDNPHERIIGAALFWPYNTMSFCIHTDHGLLFHRTSRIQAPVHWKGFAT